MGGVKLFIPSGKVTTLPLPGVPPSFSHPPVPRYHFSASGRRGAKLFLPLALPPLKSNLQHVSSVPTASDEARDYVSEDFPHLLQPHFLGESPGPCNGGGGAAGEEKSNNGGSRLATEASEKSGADGS